MTTNYFYKNSKSKFLEISGQDSVPFIQNLITNDINKCKENNFLYSCLLTPQGKFFADFFIFKNKEKFEISLIFNNNSFITLSTEIVEATLEDQNKI